MVNPWLTFLVFCLTTYGLCFLLADARIFGTDVHSFDLPEKIRAKGILPIRQLLINSGGAKEFLQCYFCTGVWMGMVAHYLLTLVFDESYWAYVHESITTPFYASYAVAAIVGGTVSYVINAFVSYLEMHQ
jgi:hypothetical protein